MDVDTEIDQRFDEILPTMPDTLIHLLGVL